MSDLKKGDLVMTEHGLGWYGNYVPSKTSIFASHSWVIIINDNIGGEYVKQATKATKEQVTEYIRGLGWEFPSEGRIYSRANLYALNKIDDTYWLSGIIPSDTFSTAPAQLAEAIQVAQLLNAVKD